MKKREFRKLALTGLFSGLLVTTPLAAEVKTMMASKMKEIAFNNDGTKKTDTDKKVDPNDGNLGYHLMTEDELMMELNDEGTAMYKALTPEGKALALKVASMRCNATNLCKGLNACQTDSNDCAGKGSCKGKGKCGMGDKNLAVKLVSKKMAEKRANS